MAADQNSDKGRPEARWADFKQRYTALFWGLFDIEFRSIITTRMVPTIYALGIALTGILVLSLVIEAFTRSWIEGLIWLFLLGPTVFVATLVALRISFEVILSFFRMAVTVDEIYHIANKISGQTDEIATDLPRIQFWRSWKIPGRKDDAD